MGLVQPNYRVCDPPDRTLLPGSYTTLAMSTDHTFRVQSRSDRVSGSRLVVRSEDEHGNDSFFSEPLSPIP